MYSVYSVYSVYTVYIVYIVYMGVGDRDDLGQKIWVKMWVKGKFGTGWEV